jgi:hypothetical protein
MIKQRYVCKANAQCKSAPTQLLAAWSDEKYIYNEVLTMPLWFHGGMGSNKLFNY